MSSANWSFSAGRSTSITGETRPKRMNSPGWDTLRRRPNPLGSTRCHRNPTRDRRYADLHQRLDIGAAHKCTSGTYWDFPIRPAIYATWSAMVDTLACLGAEEAKAG
jgi:hypothetical protein